MGKFSISYSRKVQTVMYENVAISLTREFDEDLCSPDQALKEVRDTVAKWIDAELQILRR